MQEPVLTGWNRFWREKAILTGEGGTVWMEDKEELLKISDFSEQDFPELGSQDALITSILLRRILVDLPFRQKLVLDWLTLTDGQLVQSNLPAWAYETAYRLEDPQRESNGGEKIGIENLCRELIEEFETGDRFFTGALAADPQVPGFLCVLARALLAV